MRAMTLNIISNITDKFMNINQLLNYKIAQNNCMRVFVHKSIISAQWGMLKYIV